MKDNLEVSRSEMKANLEVSRSEMEANLEVSRSELALHLVLLPEGPGLVLSVHTRDRRVVTHLDSTCYLGNRE